MKEILSKLTILVVTLLMMSHVYYATELPPFHQRISYQKYGNVIVEIGQPEAQQNVHITAGVGAYVDQDIRNFITLGIDHDLAEYMGDAYDIEVDVLITPSMNGSNQPIFTKTLSIGYHPFDQESYQDRDIYRFTNMDDFTFEITGIRIITGSVTTNVTELPKNVFLDGDIIVNRVADFTTESSSPINLLAPELWDLDCNSTPDAIHISWSTLPTAIDYQLEWTFVNNYDGTVSGTSYGQLNATALKYDFRNNSTRITTGATSYDIPMVFESGYLLWRVRAIGVNLANQPIYGVWSHVPNAGRVQFNSSYPTEPEFLGANPNGYLLNLTPHEVNKNWQLTTTFAEEGKKKEVISYYDGSLRNRQSVTVVNTDDNVIVGETIYDHQGRPAINVLPVPVVQPNCTTSSGEPSQASIKYYPQFNKVSGTVEYSRTDFDLDAGSCESALSPMNNSYGASQYYSDQNPNKADHQAYVPDAAGYPFTQVEYTPDNTGRIRRQSGVGPDFQLGSDHESKYYYGKPYQINLDRLFATEVGYAAHYKKNLVVDPNGQVSVSYLDQEGRVVATALAGEAPTDLDEILSLQDLIANGGVNLEVDLFEKDANGVSTNNIPNVTEDAIVFSQEFLVSTAGDYHFVYDFTHDAYTESCTPDLCFNCVYDLKITLTDECAAVLEEHTLMQGQFQTNSDGTVFLDYSSACENGGIYQSDVIDFTVDDLQVGNYTITKTLSINNDAIAFAFQEYLAAGQASGCINDFDDFYQEEVDAIDLSGCDVSCESCLDNLGTLDDFLAQGLGTVEDYEILEEECDALCNTPTFCETMFELMRADMAPGGQYGEYQINGSNSASSFPLSVYNTNNELPFNSFSNSVISPNWKNPEVTIDGVTYDYYLDEFGDSAKVYLSVIGSGTSASISPSVDFYDASSNDDVFYDVINGVYYTYPDRLASVYDFTSEFEYSWSQSLVIYHPEYCYYETCMTYEEEDANEVSSSDFDQLLQRTNSFQGAIDANLLVLNGSVWEVPDYGDNNNVVYDPFITTGNYGSAGTSLHNNLLIYQNVSGTLYSMQDFAAITARCGNGILSGSTSTLSTCASLWGDYAGGTAPTVTNDQEWNAFKSIYLGRKNELQRNYEDQIALNIGNNQNCLNDCIGNTDFNPYTSGMWQPAPFPNYFNNPYYNADNACSLYKRSLYAGKTKRFPDAEDLSADASASNGAYQTYLQTGQCPNTVNLQNLLNQIAQDQELDAASNDLLNYTGYGLLYGGAFAYDFTQPLPQMFWNTSNNSGGVLEVDLVEAGNTSGCLLAFDAQGQFTNWDMVVSFSGLTSTSDGSSGVYDFEVIANLSDGTHVTIVGKTCLNIADCQFEEVCDANDLALSIEEVLTLLASDGQLITPGYTLPNGVPYNNAVSIQLLNQLNASSNSNVTWKFTGTSNVAKFVNGNEELQLIFNSSTPPGFMGFASIAYFDNIQSEHQHYFALDAFDATGNLLTHLQGEALYTNDGTTFTGVPMGECGLPDPISCDGDEYELSKDLESLLTDVLISENYNIYQSSQLTNLLDGFIGGGASSSGTPTTSTSSSVSLEILDLPIINDQGENICNLSLNYESNGYGYNDIVSVESLIGVPPLQNNSFYDFELTVVMDNGSTTEMVVISGSSCLPLKNCQLCEDILELPDTTVFVEGKGEKIDPDNLYDQLIAAINDLNQREGYLPGTDEYVIAPSLKYTIENNQIYVYEEYIKFIENYDSTLDDSTYLYDINKFYVEYGHATNVEKEYARYEDAISGYNSRAAAIGATTITSLTVGSFAASKVASYNHDYINYLKTEPQATGSAENIDIYLAAVGMIDPGATLTPCEILYNDYLTAYQNFYANTSLSADEKKICMELNPMIAFEAWEKENLCCSSTGLNMIQEYINAFSYLNVCPGKLGSLKDCSDPKADLGKECQRSYELYLEEVKKFNQSNYAQTNGHVIVPITSADFLAYGYCDCIGEYLKYLEGFLATAQGTGPNAQNIDEYGPCNVIEDDCADQYEIYNETVATYNQYVKDNNLNWPSIESKLKPSQFITEGLCYCVEGYVAYLNALMSGVVSEDPTEKDIYIEFHCEEAPCVPDVTPILDTITPITIDYVNPCEEQAYNIAGLNAEIAYQAYVNSLATTFTQQMRAHCLGATENFKLDFNELEYHYTLYYYDQAGNLIKTVPPEGVELVNTNSSFDVVSQAIIADRTYKTQTVFTSHRLATKYKYNSLNQLTHQSLPDHNQMDVFALGLTDGLDPKLNVQSIQFVNENKGYLAGWVNYNGHARGLLYTTNDGGQTWQKVENTLGSDLQSVQWVGNTGTAYAVGTNGVLIQTTDGGYTWDMINTYGQNITTQLNDVVVDNSLHGFAVGNNNTIIEITGTTVSAISPIVSNTTYALDANDHITSITLAGGVYYITVDYTNSSAEQFGMLYRSGNGTNWEALPSVKADHLSKVQTIDANTYIAAGEKGTLLKSVDGGDNWFIQFADSKADFKDIYFSDVNKGIAIRESGLLYATYDGGLTWTQLDPSLSYNGLYPYLQDKVLAYGNDGEVARIIMGGSTIGIIEINGPTTGDLVAGWAGEVGSAPMLMVSTGNNQIHFTLNGTGTNPTWNTYTTTGGSVSKIEGAEFGGIVRGVIQNGAGILFGFEANGSSFSDALVPTASTNFTVLDKNNSNNEFVVYDANSGDLSSLNGSTGIPASFNTLANIGTVTLNELSIDNTGVNYVLTGNDGTIVKTIDNAGSFTTIDQTYRVRTHNWSDATMVDNTLEVVGENGGFCLLDLSTSSNDKSTLVGTADEENYQAIDANGSIAILVGDNGVARKANNTGIVGAIATGVSEDLTAVNLDPTSTNAYYGSASGQLFRSLDYTTTLVPFTSISSTSDESVNAIHVNGNGVVSYVGNNAHIYQGGLSMAYQIKDIYTPKLVDVNFSSITNGYVIGDNYTVRHTSNGGQSWSTILPAGGFPGGSIPNVNAVYTQTGTEAIVVGNQKYVAKVNAGIATTLSGTAIPTPGNYPLHDITFADANNGIIVGGSNASGRIWLTSNGGLTWTAVSNANMPVGTEKLRGVYAFERNNTYVAVGNGESMVYIQSLTDVDDISSNVVSAPGTDLYDVYFYDDVIGYAVGTNGTLLKTSNVTLSGTGFITGVTWGTKDVSDDFNSNLKNIYAIDFATRYQGVLGGLHTTGPAADRNYTRTLRDESDEFSTYFWYDRLGRIVVSQNSKQYNADEKRYSYTLYDELGRVVEAGEKVENTTANNQHRDIFGTYVSGLYNPKVIDDVKLINWITNPSGKRQEVTHSYYDYEISNATIGITAVPGFIQNELNLRKRISAVTYEKVYDGLNNTYNYGTFYEYDIHGNVQTLIQHNKDLGNNSNPDIQALQYKRMDYDYDLISGNVHEVAYQDGEADAWYHRYEYDGDNRITTTETSQDKVTWDQDAKYIYYDHGPLARVEIGENSVQGMDYVYTLQGWLKGVNSDLLNPNNDVGQDGASTSSATINVNAHFARDAYGFSLTYYEDDYSPIDYVNKWQQESTRFASVFNPGGTDSDVSLARKDLYNGNIGAMVTTITQPTLYASTGGITPNILPQATAYKYDQLNRLVEAKAYQNVVKDNSLSTYNTWGLDNNYQNEYYNAFKYDASGNITHQDRYDHAGNYIENLEYHYATDGGKLLQNRLYSVSDYAGATEEALYDDDIEDMGWNGSPFASINDGNENYRYDAIGQLIQDQQEGIAEIIWRVDGKIAAIIRAPGSEAKNLIFDYDPMGNRIAKHVYGNSVAPFDPDNPTDWEKSTYYNRDAQGNVITVYEYVLEIDEIDQTALVADINNNSIPDYLIRDNLQATSPLNESVLIALINSGRPDWVKDAVLNSNAPFSENVLLAIVTSSMANNLVRDYLVQEAPLSDAVLLAMNGQNYPGWVVDPIVSACTPLTDDVLIALVNHSPNYGNNYIRDWMMANTLLSQDVWDAINAQNYPGWVTNAIAGADAGYAGLPASSYVNTVVNTAGTVITGTSFKQVERNIYGSSRVGMDRTEKEMIAAITTDTDFEHTLGMKQYELSNHLGNVLSVITDRKHPIDEDGNGFIDYYQPEIVKATDYSPFGVELYERNFNREEVLCLDTDEQWVVQDEDDFSGYAVNAQANGWTHIYGTGSVTAQETYRIQGQNTGGPPTTIVKILATKDWSNQLIVGDEYEISFDVVAKNGSISFSTATGGIGTSAIVGAAGSTFTMTFTATSTDGSFNLYALGLNFANTYITIDNLQLKHKELIQETCTVPVGQYRYGFQGQERDDEVKGEGNSINYKYRMHDPRLGRFFAVDPLFRDYPHNSVYAFSENRVIDGVELEGLEYSGAVVEGNTATYQSVPEYEKDDEIKTTDLEKSQETIQNMEEQLDNLMAFPQINKAVFEVEGATFTWTKHKQGPDWTMMCNRGGYEGPNGEEYYNGKNDYHYSTDGPRFPSPATPLGLNLLPTAVNPNPAAIPPVVPPPALVNAQFNGWTSTGGSIVGGNGIVLSNPGAVNPALTNAANFLWNNPLWQVNVNAQTRFGVLPPAAANLLVVRGAVISNMIINNGAINQQQQLQQQITVGGGNTGAVQPGALLNFIPPTPAQVQRFQNAVGTTMTLLFSP